MPQELYWVREKESGQAVQMHSVDVTEGMALGDYELIADPAHDLTPDERAAGVLGGARSIGGLPHPELMTPEERAETRRRVKEEADAAAQVISGPLGVPMYVPPGQSAPPATQRTAGGQFTARQAPPSEPVVPHDAPEPPIPPAPGRTPTRQPGH